MNMVGMLKTKLDSQHVMRAWKERARQPEKCQPPLYSSAKLEIENEEASKTKFFNKLLARDESVGANPEFCQGLQIAPVSA